MTLSNWITLIRIVLIPVFMAFLLSDLETGAYLAAVVFTLAALTDTVDGYLARVRRETTFLGEVIDPFADKLLISAALVSLVQIDRLSAWIAMVIIAREFFVSGLRVVVISRGKRVPASIWGKLKTFSQIVAVIAWVLLPDRASFYYHAFYYFAIASIALALVLTVYSAFDYFRVSLPYLTNGEG